MVVLHEPDVAGLDVSEVRLPERCPPPPAVELARVDVRRGHDESWSAQRPWPILYKRGDRSGRLSKRSG